MKPIPADRRTINRLFKIRNRFDETASKEKLVLLESLYKAEAQTGSELERLHTTLCFVRAFPGTTAHYRLAKLQLESFEERVDKLPAMQRSRIWDSGIVGTPIHYYFSFEVASWLVKRAPNTVSIDWSAIEDTSRLDELLEHLLLPSEEDYFDGGYVSSEEWIRLASSQADGTDFDWLFAQLGDVSLRSIWSQLYNASELPLAWNLRNVSFSKTDNVATIHRIQTRSNGMRRRIPAVKKEVMRPLGSLQRLPSRSGARLIEVAMSVNATGKDQFSFGVNVLSAF